MSRQPTAAPSAASRSAVALPMPDAAPVTSAVRPSKREGVVMAGTLGRKREHVLVWRDPLAHPAGPPRNLSSNDRRGRSNDDEKRPPSEPVVERPVWAVERRRETTRRAAERAWEHRAMADDDLLVSRGVRIP